MQVFGLIDGSWIQLEEGVQLPEFIEFITFPEGNDMALCGSIKETFDMLDKAGIPYDMVRLNHGNLLQIKLVQVERKAEPVVESNGMISYISTVLFGRRLY